MAQPPKERHMNPPDLRPIPYRRTSTYRALLGQAVGIALLFASVGVAAQSSSWDIPQATVRAVLQRWAQDAGYGVVWSEGIPDFPTRQARVDGDLAGVAASLVNGSAYGGRNMYCPPAVRFPATAYTLTARVDSQARLIFVYGIATNQECRPL